LKIAQILKLKLDSPVAGGLKLCRLNFILFLEERMTYLQLPHKVAEYACPINGLEDMYEWKTGQRLPGYFLMDLSMTGFLYIKQKNAPTPRMVFWGNGTGRPQHELLADIIGYNWTCSEDKSFTTSWKLARESIDRGIPVILGLLDMYHLPYYPHIYHRIHIPQHYVLLVGYDADRNVAFVQDNGLPKVQNISMNDLKEAWNVNNPGQGKKNTLFVLEFKDNIAPMEEIVAGGLKKKANLILNPPVGFMGIKGMRKLAADMTSWPRELTKKQVEDCLKAFVTFTCSVVPMPPQRLLPYKIKNPDSHQAVRDRFSHELKGFADQFDHPEWKESARILAESGRLIGMLTDVLIDQILVKTSDLEESARLVSQIADLEEKAWCALA
jgi:hypothetical protein